MNWILLVVYFTTSGWHIHTQEFRTFDGCKKAQTFFEDSFKLPRYTKAKCIIDGGKNDRTNRESI